MKAYSKRTARTWVITGVSLAAVGLVGAWLTGGLKIGLLGGPMPTAAPYDARAESPSKIFDTAVSKDSLVSGISDIKVKKGEAVRVNITAVGPDEVHASLPGYGITTEVTPTDDTPGGFSFVADKTGVFPFYSDTKNPSNGKVISQRKIGTITVQ